MGSRFEPTQVLEPQRSITQTVPSVGSTSTPAVEPHFRPSGMGSTCPTQGFGRSFVGSHQCTIGALLFCAGSPTGQAATTAAATRSHFALVGSIESSNLRQTMTDATPSEAAPHTAEHVLRLRLARAVLALPRLRRGESLEAPVEKT